MVAFLCQPIKIVIIKKCPKLQRIYSSIKITPYKMDP